MKKPTEAESSIVAAKTVISEKNSEIINLSDSLELENDVFEGLDIEAHLDKIDEQHKISQPLQPKVWPIDRLVNSIPNISNGKFKIKCKFKSIVEKMILVDEEFHLVIEVEDETGDISVKLHSDIVADLIGFSAAELMKLKAEIMENNFAAQSKILEGLKGLKEKLIELDKIAEVQVNVREKYPVVLKFF
ncbi:hypothetical protein JTB14_035649 [Gonioctena quinquepunctata]|nr:hypothetical protein JTB14_035649 [Gonioctena quinquepunctata]